jgi:hypothetical protein
VKIVPTQDIATLSGGRPRKFILLIWALLKSAPSNCAFPICTPPVQFVPTILAELNLADTTSAPEKSTLVKSALVKSKILMTTPAARESENSALVNFAALALVVPLNLALV